MVEQADRLDRLIEDAKPGLLVQIAALAVGLHGLVVLAVGVQSMVLLTTSGWRALFPPALVAVGGLTVFSAYGMGRFLRSVGWAGPLMAALAALLSGVWVLVCATGLVLMPLALLAAGAAPVPLALSLVAIPSWLRCSRARAQLRIELAEDAPRQAGVGGLVAAAAVVLVLGAGAWFVIGGMSAGDPMVLAIVRRGEVHADADQRAVRQLARSLENRGLFPAVVDAPLPADGSLDEARGAARAEGAGHLLVLDLVAEEEREGVLPATALFAVRITAHLTSSRPGDEEVASSETMEFAYERATAGQVVDEVAETWADVLQPWTLDALFARESFQPVLALEVPSGRVLAASGLMELRAGVQARRDRAAEWAAWCQAEGERLDALADAEPGVGCYGDPCSPWSLIGSTAEGHAVVQDAPRVPMFRVPPTVKPQWTEPPERLLVLDPERPEAERDLIRSGNIYGLARIEPGGRFAAVETFAATGAQALVTLDVATGEPVDVAVLAPRQRTNWVRPGLDGGPALVRLKRGGAGLIWADGGLDLPPLDEGFWVRTPDGDRVLGQLGEEAALYDTEGQATGRLSVQGWITAAEWDDESLYVMDGHAGACRVRQLDPRSLRVRKTTPLAHCLRRPRRLADGRWLGLAPLSAPGDAPGDDELVLWDPVADALLPLTANSFDEEKVSPTPDGRYAWIHRRLEDWPREFDTKLYRRQVCRVEIP